MDYKILLAAIVLLLLAVVASAVKKSGAKGDRLRRIDLMTKNELEFWRILVDAVPPLNVAPQVAMGALLDAQTGLSKSERTSTRNRFDRQRVDFVLFDDLGVVQLLVELDDSTHRPAQDALRDQRTSSVGYKTLRVRRRDVRTAAELKALVGAQLNPAPEVTGF